MMRYLSVTEEAIVTIEQNLKVQGKILRQYKSYHPAALMSRLGEVYQNMPELLYWEHFGRMDSQPYRDDNSTIYRFFAKKGGFLLD